MNLETRSRQEIRMETRSTEKHTAVWDNTKIGREKQGLNTQGNNKGSRAIWGIQQGGIKHLRQGSKTEYIACESRFC